MKHLYLKYKPYYKDSLKLAIPVVISQMGHTLVQISDTIIIGQFAGTVALAAVSLVISIFIVPMVLGIGISYGITPLIAQLNGRGERDECGRLLSNTIWLNLFAGIILFGCGYFGVMLFIDKLGQSPAVVAAAKPFLFLLSLSLIPMLIFNAFKQFAEGLGFTKQAMQITIWGNVLNILVGIVLVKGMFGIPAQGVRGVGYSTLLDRCLMALIMGIYVMRSALFRPFLQKFAIFSIQFNRLVQLVMIGAPVALQYAFEVSAFGGAAILIGTIGLKQQAAHQVAINMAATTYMMAAGISAAASIRSGNHFGAGNHLKLRLSAISNYHIVIAFMCCTALIFTLFHQWLPYIYTTDKDVVHTASQLLIIAAFFQLFDGTQVVGLGILRGMGDVNMPTVITFLSYWVIGLPVGYFIGIHLHYGVLGVWLGLVCGLMSASVMLFIRFQQMSRKHKIIAEVV